MLLVSAYNDTEYYRALFNSINFNPIQDFKTLDDLTKIPVLTKKIARNNHSQLINKKFNNKCLKLRTSGSTGEPFEVNVSYNAWIVEQAVIWRHWKWAGYKFRDKMGIIRSYTPKDDKTLIYKDKIRNFTYFSPFHLTKENMDIYMDIILNEGFLACRLYSDGRGKYNFTVPAGGSELPSSADTVEKELHYFQMNGKAVYDTGTLVLPKAINQVLADTGLSINDIDFMVPHQPSIVILKKTAEIIGLPFEKVMTNMDRYANTSGGTIPILLDELKKSKRLKNGHIILFAAVGSGWTYGASIIKWS